MQRLAREWLRPYRCDVLRIAAEDFGDALRVLRFFLVRTSAEDDERGFAFRVAQDHRQFRPVGRDGGIAAAARRLLPKLALLPAARASDRHRIRRQLGGEAAVEPLRRIAEDAGERAVETAALACGHTRPEIAKRIGSVLFYEPFEECRSREIGH